jgi:ribose-phosphate pyrophosphokinase
VSVRDHDVYVIDSLHADAVDGVHDKLCRLALFVGAVRDAAAGRITAVVPYLCYGRKDARTKLRDPVSTRYVAMMLEAVGTERIVTMDVHNLAAFENAFRCGTEHLEAARLFAAHFRGRLVGADTVVVSPDPGGVKRAERFRLLLEAALGHPVGSGFLEKHRSEGIVSGGALIGAVRGRAVIVLDDLISTGTTLDRAARACRAAGAAAVFAAATHGLFTGEAGRILSEAPLDQLVVTDTVPPFRLGPKPLGGKLVVLDTAPLLASVIGRLHAGESIAALGEEG